MQKRAIFQSNPIWVLVLSFLLVCGLSKASLAATQKRFALVIGNALYPTQPLLNPENDARDIADILRKAGFHVTLKTNATKKTMETSIRSFGKTLRQGGVGLFYFAGHGIQLQGRNYLIPVDAVIESESDARYGAVDAGLVLGKMEDAANGLNIVILDACRNNPFGRSFRSMEKGLAKMDAPRGSILAYATGPGSVAADGTGRNGLYTAMLIKHMLTPHQKIEEMFKKVRVDVAQASGNKQTPWESSSLMGDFAFARGRAITVTPALPATGVAPAPLPPRPKETGDFESIIAQRRAARKKWSVWQGAMALRWAKVKGYDKDQILTMAEKVQVCKEFLSDYAAENPHSHKDNELRETARAQLSHWEVQVRTAKQHEEGSRQFKVKGASFKMMKILAGEFMMGSPSAEKGRFKNERQHRVRLTRDYWIGETEVTQGLWQAVMGDNPSSFDSCGKDCPVEKVSWDDCQDFIKRLNRQATEGRFRLPTEAEWEYASRAGSITAFENGRITELKCGEDPMLDAMGWYCGNSSVTYSNCYDASKWGGPKCGGTHPVAMKHPNGWGLYDMHGNVWEWCQDWYRKDYSTGTDSDPKGPSSGSDRVFRGGSWYDLARHCRSADRDGSRPGYRNDYLGFRLAFAPGQ